MNGIFISAVADENKTSRRRTHFFTAFESNFFYSVLFICRQTSNIINLNLAQNHWYRKFRSVAVGCCYCSQWLLFYEEIASTQIVLFRWIFVQFYNKWYLLLNDDDVLPIPCDVSLPMRQHCFRNSLQMNQNEFF